MVNPTPKRSATKLSPEHYARLRAEAKAPYRGLRRFVYVTLGASGLIGAFIFLTQLAAGTGGIETLPNVALQLGIVALMVGLFRLDRGSNRRS